MSAQTPQKRFSESPTSGLYSLKRAVNILGGRYIDKRYRVGRAMAKWKDDITRDLGGNLSTQKAEIVELAAKQKLLLDSVDAWLLTQKSLVNGRKRALLPVVRERQALADSLARFLTQLGLERVAKQVSWEDYVKEIKDETQQRASEKQEDSENSKVEDSGGDPT
jgi:hypothetical protein